MNQTEAIVSNVANRMLNLLTEDQMKGLKQALYIVLYDYDIQEKETALVEVDGPNYNEVVKMKYFAALKAEGKSKETIANYKLILNLLLDHTTKPLQEITTDDLRYFLFKYQETRKVGNTTLDNMRRVYSAFFGWCCDEDYISKDPTRRISPIKHDTIKETVFSNAELEKLRNACKCKRDRAVIELLNASAIRVSECSRINRSDIDWKNKTILIEHGKGNKSRYVYFDDVACLYLQEYLATRTDSNPALFLSENNKDNRASKHLLEQMVSRTGKRAGVINAHPHRFRTTKITSLLVRGMALQDVQEIAGHAAPTTTRGYYRASQDRIRHEYQRAS